MLLPQRFDKAGATARKLTRDVTKSNQLLSNSMLENLSKNYLQHLAV